MAKARKGDLFSCQACGLILSVDEPCGCVTCEIICCGKPMAKGKAAANKAREKATGLTAAKKSTAKTQKTTATQAKAAKSSTRAASKPAAKKTTKKSTARAKKK